MTACVVSLCRSKAPGLAATKVRAAPLANCPLLHPARADCGLTLRCCRRCRRCLHFSDPHPTLTMQPLPTPTPRHLTNCRIQYHQWCVAWANKFARWKSLAGGVVPLGAVERCAVQQQHSRPLAQARQCPARWWRGLRRCCGPPSLMPRIWRSSEAIVAGAVQWSCVPGLLHCAAPLLHTAMLPPTLCLQGCAAEYRGQEPFLGEQADQRWSPERGPCAGQAPGEAGPHPASAPAMCAAPLPSPAVSAACPSPAPRLRPSRPSHFGWPQTAPTHTCRQVGSGQ